MLADGYAPLSNAAEDYDTFQLCHSLALDHLAEARKHKADSVFAGRRVPELSEIIEQPA
jgi:hypothetical protein